MNKRYTLNDYCDDLTIGKGILYIEKKKNYSFPIFLTKMKEFCYERYKKNSKNIKRNTKNLA